MDLVAEQLHSFLGHFQEIYLKGIVMMIVFCWIISMILPSCCSATGGLTWPPMPTRPGSLSASAAEYSNPLTLLSFRH